MKPHRLILTLLSTLLWASGLPAAAIARPQVSGATPERVELVAGGDAAAVEIAGTDLQRAERAAVLLNGKSAADVTVKLASSSGADGTRRTVFLQALDRAPAAAGLELVLYFPVTRRGDTGASRVPLDLSVTVPGPAQRTELSRDDDAGGKTGDPVSDPAPEWPVVLSAGRLEFTPELSPATFTPVMIQTTTLEFTPQAAPPTFTPVTIQAGRLEFTPEATP